MDILSRPVLPADHRIAYGEDPSQFGDLWLPDRHTGERFPVVAFFHGGWWKSKYDLGYAGYLCAALRREGIAVWSIEYRRVGATGGGWPHTLLDAAGGFEYLSTLAESYPLDLSRVITVGHSAGGHLAFWIAGRRHIQTDREVFPPRMVSLRGAIALAGVVDLGLTLELAADAPFFEHRADIEAVMGGGPREVPERYRQGDPGQLVPSEGRLVLIQGERDDQIPPGVPGRFAEKARRAGCEVDVLILAEADHLDVVDPESDAWSFVVAETVSLLRK